jgi:hypothetical protein
VVFSSGSGTGQVFYPLANEVAKGYSNATFRNILVNTLG